MDCVSYKFEQINPKKQSNYIFQLVRNRKLTDINHSHNFYELIYFLNGTGIQVINGDEYTCEKNSLTLIRPCDTHFFLQQSKSINVLSLSIKKEEFELITQFYDPILLSSIQNQKQFIYSNSTALPTLFDYINQKSESINEYDCKFVLSYFLNMYIESVQHIQNHLKLPKMLAFAVNEIKKKENLQQGIPAFIELSHYSQSHLSRLIRKYFNMSLKEYINEIRLQNAYNDIILTNKALSDISEDIGFSSFSHFNKIFKARFSITPSRLRKNSGAWTT